MDKNEEIAPETLKGMIEIRKSELSAKILESLFHSRLPEIPYSDLLEKMELRYKERIYYEERRKSLYRLKELDLIEIVRKSAPIVKITPMGIETLRLNKLVERLVLEPLIDDLSEAAGLTKDEIDILTEETQKGYIEILERFEL